MIDSAGFMDISQEIFQLETFIWNTTDQSSYNRSYMEIDDANLVIKIERLSDTIQAELGEYYE